MIAELQNEEIILKNSWEYKDAIKSIPGRKWSSKQKVWTLPLTADSVEALKHTACQISNDILKKYKILKDIRERTKEEKFTEMAAPIEPMPLIKTIKPFQHQIKAYNMALMNNSFAFLMEMGTGKSLAAVAVTARRYLDGDVKKCLVIAPASVCPVWPEEFKSAIVMHKVTVLEGSIIKRIQMLNDLSKWINHLQVVVINYEATWRMLDELLAWTPDMVICDESQRIKNPQAQQSKAIHKIGDITKYKLILTGTPVQNAPLDFYSQYRFLDKKIFGTSYYAFRARYARMGGYGNHQVLGYNKLDELTKKAHSIAYRVTKEEALDLPEQIDQFRYCDLEPKARRAYEEIKQESFTELETGDVTATNVLTKLLRLSQITGGFLKNDDGIESKISEAKLNVLDEIIDDVVIEGKKKIVIFVRFIKEIDAIKKMFESKGINYVWIAGEVDMKDRGTAVDRFQHDKGCMAFIGQIDTAGAGITLHAADTAVFYSLNFNCASYEQARARIHRIGQKNNCTYIHLLAKCTIDEKIMKALQKKQDIAKQVVDNWREYFK